MAQTSNISDEERMLAEFKEGADAWAKALEAHRLAPPDQNFSARLATLARAASEEARVCRAGDAAGFDWTPHRAAGSEPPYELRPGTGRRGPAELWRRFDEAAASLSAVSTGRDILEVARAYDGLAVAAGELAGAIEQEDRASGSRPRARKRRSA
jgi:hypothetical protein